MYKFTHIENVYNIIKFARNRVFGEISFRGTVKLHGTNASVVCSPRDVTPQSRNRQLSIQKDNMGFACFVKKREMAIREIELRMRKEYNLSKDLPLSIYGEFVGQGIQQGVAVSNLPRHWVVFAVKIGNLETEKYVDAIFPLNDKYKEFDIHSILDVKSWEVSLDFNDREVLEQKVKEIETITQEVEDLCPWGEKFGISGTGEGVVWVPTGEHWGNTRLFFKTKGPKHRVVNKAKRNRSELDPEIIKSVEEFVKYSVTENRLNQGIDYLKEMNMPIDMTSTGNFLKWIGNDVARECENELVENDLTWKQVARSVNAKARDFFVKKVKSEIF